MEGMIVRGRKEYYEYEQLMLECFDVPVIQVTEHSLNTTQVSTQQ